MWFLSRSCMQYLYRSQFYLLSPWNKASNIHSIINVLCALWGVWVLLVSLRHSVSHLWKMPEKRLLKQLWTSYCFVASPVLSLKLHNCLLCFYLISFIVSTLKPHFERRKSTMNTVMKGCWERRDLRYAMLHQHVKGTCVFLLLSNNNTCLILQLLACKHICYCKVLQ